MQGLHAFENHEHTVCESIADHHIHELIDLDCSDLHIQLETFSPVIFAGINVIPQHFYSNNFIYRSQVTTKVYFSKKSSRGPPHFIV